MTIYIKKNLKNLELDEKKPLGMKKSAKINENLLRTPCREFP
jgi:hypothetical protein